MNALVGFWTIALAALSSVHALDVVPAENRTEVVIGVDGPVVVRDFPLTDPARIVVDLEGTTHQFDRSGFPGIDRGGVRGIRLSQYRPEIVRIVVDLVDPVEYAVDRGDDEIRVSFTNPRGPFDAWSSHPSGDDGAAASLGVAPLDVEPAPEAAAETTPAAEAASAGVEELPRSAPRAQQPRAPVQDPQEQPRITITYDNLPIRELLRTFGEHADRSIVFGPDVNQTVSGEIRNQPWDVALEAILTAHGLAATETETGIIRIDSVDRLQQAQRTERLITRTVPINYASVDSILPAARDLVCAMGGTGMSSDTMAESSNELAFLALGDEQESDQCRGGVARNRSTNALIITAGESSMPSILETLEQLDVRTPQVTINAKIIFIDRSRLEGLGVTYDLKDSQGNQLNQLVPGIADLDGDGEIGGDERAIEENVVSLGGSSIAGLANATQRIASPTLQLVSSLVLGRHTLVSFLDALETQQFTEVQAHPALQTLDNRAARVQVGEETPVRVVDAGAGAGGQQGAGGFPRAAVEFRETGIILEVTPRVTGNQVLLEVHAERSNVGLAPSDIGVVFNTQEAETQVLVDDGETAVISGLTIIEKSEVRSGIPLLMDLPMIGALFRSTNEEETKQDLLIMVTPHIVREGDA